MDNKVYTSDVRFSSIYSLLRMLLEREMKNLTFTFTEDGMVINPYKGTIGIELFIDESYYFSPFAFNPDEDVLSLKIILFFTLLKN